ncbi:hypothetical protein BGX23_006944 [Mortierella sp. AD031]|nr:hypothetical protein BGX23_006944 [Mortierella sp. AD031]
MSFMFDTRRGLEPHRIAAVPDTILDVIVDDQLGSIDAALSREAQAEAPLRSLQEELNSQEESVTHAASTTPTIPNTSTTSLNATYNPGDQPQQNNEPLEPQQSSNDTQPPVSQEPNHTATNNTTKTTINTSPGDRDAQIALGDLYMERRGTTPNYKLAMDWFLKAAEQGDPRGQRRIGYLYYHGYGVMQNYSTAMEWYRKAADQGNAEAQREIGFLYKYGRGVPKDYSQAMEWYKKAADQGDKLCQEFYDELKSQSK